MEEMTERFYREPYCREFQAVVTACEKRKNGWAVALDDTAFYPEGGGQPADHGVLDDVNVLDVHRRDGVIWHETDGPLEEGKTVSGKIDWERRFRHMQNHTGEHIVSGLIHQKTGYDNVGFHMGKEIQIDFNGPMSAEQIREVELEANRIIMNNTPVQETFPSAEELAVTDYRSKKELSGKVRLISIPGADLCACCGTHVKTAGEVGLVKILGFEKHKDGVRIFMKAGLDALEEVIAVYDENHKISAELSAEMQKTHAAVVRLKQENEDRKRALYAMTVRYLDTVVDAVEDGAPLVICAEEDIERTLLGKLAERLLEEKHARVAAVLNRTGEDRFTYLICSRSVDLRPYAKTLNSALNGRGGGKPEYIQGSFAAPLDAIRAELEKVFG
ncbi:MAG: hypothetical protein IKG46_01360 [Solobacterium sp.]|nr:hypothetical protein [Solobacterium sp.]